MIIIGEKLNATVKDTREIIDKRDSAGLVNLARLQTERGATYIDVNVGTGKGSQQDEIETMRWAVETLSADTDAPLCIDSADPKVIEAGLEALNGGNGMINSTKAEEEHMDEVIPLAVTYDLPVVALAMDETGIPATVKGRLAACEKVIERSIKFGLPMEKIFFDPLVLPVSTDNSQGKITLETLSAIGEQLPETHTVMGLSNVSYGLPGRKTLNSAFLQMAIYVGLDAVIINPLEKTMMDAILAGEALIGKDRHFRRYTRFFKKSKTA